MLPGCATWEAVGVELPDEQVYELGSAGEYELVRRVGAGEVLRVEKPFPVAFDPARLVDD
ncbi:hypothetical protein LX15_003881 [Streptoalloteichus tenebrarius]|uniref:Uncharacterized protein n=1 Tax=Streptoalloteichus tenebrarius (strain ATCC 17920 / DSM 40477 / JCM 4838 / CBS 697.72 / NBRC 16177 / NCIMB 11028 / NRRL B-12390 / A12253. 1 / ISP 5477) TaxID=1933 RepID=A0ABT1HXC1_STRSD|nr:hypothetical protein [Streptoalloteichus tenebrarius]BFF02625.1 hypothetical protein GCM10020241_43000 [Streptoalloteichus tenebrarius]